MQVVYDRARYDRYSNLPLVDEVKKALELEVVAELLESIRTGGRALDVGTATGRYAGFLADREFDVVGIDISEDALLAARTNLARRGLAHRVHLLRMDALHLDSLGPSFDLLTCMMGTFCHVSPARQVSLLGKIWSVLRPDGTVILSCWDPECSFTNFLSMYGEAERDALLANSPSSHLLECRMKRAGFSEVETHAVCCSGDEQIAQLVVEEGEYDLVAELQRYLQARFPLLKGQLYVSVGRKHESSVRVP